MLLSSVLASYPYQLWQLIDEKVPVEQAVNSILADRCKFDDFTEALVQTFPDFQNLSSAHAKSILEAVGLLLRLDTSRIECWHAWLRRLFNYKGQTWKHHFAHASADWFLARQRNLEDEAGNLPAAKKETKTRRGGGGMCRACLA